MASGIAAGFASSDCASPDCSTMFFRPSSTKWPLRHVGESVCVLASAKVTRNLGGRVPVSKQYNCSSSSSSICSSTESSNESSHESSSDDGAVVTVRMLLVDPGGSADLFLLF